MSIYAEMLAGTDPADRASMLVLENAPRPADLTEADRTPLAANQDAIYFQSLPGRSYAVQWTDSLDGASRPGPHRGHWSSPRPTRWQSASNWGSSRKPSQAGSVRSPP